ncbi:Uncharacterised protein [Vibrio cholerae]|nr:Uncharacterised protein [Vibrio cholerae]CSI44965.1 Uncharacterised protein [Vibrio cholerae]CSI55687.1 Uncharacterised protein [Vibrio cholerae]
MTMVTAFKLDDFVTACITTRKTNRTHRRFSARVHHPQLFH